MSGSEDDRVGYRRPPKSGQFRKGVSGNPRGRPRKAKSEAEPAPAFPAARHPTRRMLLAEAEREITITDAKGTHKLSARQAVIRAMTVQAMKGGVLAGRTVLQLFEREDERFHQERKHRYEFWDKYRRDGLAEIEAARTAGLPEPDLLPHPEDIELNAHKLEVHFVGPVDEADKVRFDRLMRIRDLNFEISTFLGEERVLPNCSGADGRLGVFFGLFLDLELALPPRLRGLSKPDSGMSERYETQLGKMRSMGKRAWAADLEARCKAADYDMSLVLHYQPKLTVSFQEIGLKWPKNRRL